jgi:hypothetical protein
MRNKLEWKCSPERKVHFSQDMTMAVLHDNCINSDQMTAARPIFDPKVKTTGDEESEHSMSLFLTHLFELSPPVPRIIAPCFNIGW